MTKINGICYIIGAFSEKKIIEFNPLENDLVIAADGGYDLLKNTGVKCDILLGDFDSINKVPDCDAIRFPQDKDETDSFLAYELGFQKGYRNFVVAGGVGGRLDHTIANFQMLSNMAKNGARGFLVSEEGIVTAINSSISFTDNLTGKIGIFSYGERAEGIAISGLKYTVSDASFTSDFPIGASNEFIGIPASVSVQNGILLVSWKEASTEFFKNFDLYRV